MRVAGEPRPAGGSAEARVREICRARLAAAGFDVAEQPFEYSTFPGRWATPIGGVIACLTVVSAAALGDHGRAGPALTLIATAALVLVIGGRMIARRVTTLSWARASSVNLIATRGMPRVWLVAHLDSKSQPVAMLARVAGIVLEAC